MSEYVRAAVNVPQVSGVFDYLVPPALSGLVEPGCLLSVPFGRQVVQAVALERIASPSVPQPRPILEILDPLPVLTLHQMKLAEWLAQETLSTLAQCVGLMIPRGLKKYAQIRYRLRSAGKDFSALAPLGQRILTLLQQRGQLSDGQLAHALPRQAWQTEMRSLVNRGWVQAESYLPAPSVRPRYLRMAQLACPPAEALAQLERIGRAGSTADVRRGRIVEFLSAEKLPVELSWVYAQTGAVPADLHKLAEEGIVALSESEIWRDPLAEYDVPLSEPPILTPHQQAAWQQVEDALDSAQRGEAVRPHLLHGVTGSGKTEIYLRAVERVVRSSRQALVLVPEIALTPQTVRRFLGRFPGQVGLVHSRLSEGERYDTWRRARAGALPVIIGARSALFTPLPAPGLIVLDECHDGSYYQDDPSPAYDARSAAVHYAAQCGAVCLFGSATPEVTQTYQVEQKRWVGIKLPLRVLAHQKAVEGQVRALGITIPPHAAENDALWLDLPAVQVVDMREELKAGNRSIFSTALAQALAEVLEKKQQAILFLNRRGTATYIFCRTCGSSLQCPRCAIPLTYHTGEGEGGLTCHHCGYQRQMPKRCPTCGSAEIRQYGTGTERVEQDLHSRFPQARILRWDAETAREKGAHEVLLAHFSARRADVLIGTQMVAKGLDLPLVTLVGVVLADTGLNLPDYRAAERTFQVLMQVAGRAGRSILGGRVIVQTYMPEHYAVAAAAGHDYAAFYARELEYRRRLGYPPFYRLLRLEYRHSDATRAAAETARVAAAIRECIRREDLRATEVIGPAPCFYARLAGEYRWQVVVRSPNPRAAAPEKLPPGWRVEVDPPVLL